MLLSFKHRPTFDKLIITKGKAEVGLRCETYLPLYIIPLLILKIACENWKLNWNFVNEYIALLFSLTLKNYAACSQALTSLWQNRRIPGQILKKKLWFWQTEDEDRFPEIIFLAVWRYGDDARWCANDKSAADHLSFHIRQTTPYCTISYLAICILIVDHTILYDSIPHNYSLDHIILYHIIQYNLYFDIKQTTQNYTIL